MPEYSPGIYFLTGSTFLHYPYFKDDQDKEILLDQIKKLKKEKGIQICAYSIQMNHYHIIINAKTDTDVALVKQYMHGGTSHRYRLRHKNVYNEIWGTKKTIRVWNEDMYWKIIGYVCGNLLKHRELGTFEELKDSWFSSYGYFARKYGDEMMKEIVYRVIDVDENAENSIEMEEMKEVKIRKPE